MQDFLFEYHGVSPTTWAYLSSLLMIGLFFKFGRFWSVRNLDLAMLIFLAPGLLLVHFGHYRLGIRPTSDESGDGATTQVDGTTKTESTAQESLVDTDSTSGGVDETRRSARLELIGYYWLFAMTGFWLVRLLLDPAMIRRPLLIPNLSVGGLTFIGIFLFVFLMANVVTRPSGATQTVGASPVADNPDAEVPRNIARHHAPRMDHTLSHQQERGPGYAVLNMLPTNAKKGIAICSHLAVVIGLVMIGYRHFDNLTNGIGAAMLYLMLPYTSQMTGRVDHVLPAAMLVWAVLCYRRPLVAGCFMGAACGCIYYPLFALPIWMSFYWSRGLFRFLGSVIVVLLLMAIGLALTSESSVVWSDLQRMFGVLRPAMEGLEGFWNERIGGVDPYFRIPVLAAFVVLSFGLALWPARKTMGTIICYTAAVMVAAQFWHGYGGGLYMAWYLPLVLLTIFRPNLEDRVAQAVIVDRWLSRTPPSSSDNSLAA